MAAADPSNDLFLQGVEAEDPAPFVHRLREEDPVHRVAGLGFWIVTRHEDVKRLFNDPENVDNDPRLWEHHEPRGSEGSFLRWVEDNGLFAMPPEAHARIRRLVVKRGARRAGDGKRGARRADAGDGEEKGGTSR